MPSRSPRRRSEFVKVAETVELIGEPRPYYPLRCMTLDIGSNMAVAHNLNGTNDARVAHKLFEGKRAQRAAATLVWLREIFAQAKDHPEGPPDFIMYERPFARGRDATRSLWGLAGIIEALAADHGWPVLDVENKTLKAWATGRGDASKDDMGLFAFTTGYMGENEHEADTWCQLRYAEAHVSFKPPRAKRTRKEKA